MTCAEHRVLLDAFFLFEGTRFKGDRKRHWKGDDIYSICQAGRKRGRMKGQYPQET
jgi:hypothetical protein